MKSSERIACIDILRGLDIFFLTFFGPVISAFLRPCKAEWLNPIKHQLTHVNWEGLVAWDMIMPLFLFTAGLSLPFSLSKYVGNEKGELWKRIAKRVVMLWLLGMVMQGNLLGFNPKQLYLFSNTLQSIAVGYLFSAIFFLYLPLKGQIGVSLALLLSYWGVMKFAGLGDYSPEGNIAEAIDKTVLGRFRDGVSWKEDGTWEFASWYHYTWILSSLNFVVTVMTGVFAGSVLRMKELSHTKRLQYLLMMGVGMIAAGYLWSLDMPIIKILWTSSMTLVTSGISTLLLALFFYLTDICNGGKYFHWLQIWGMNSIAAYFLATYFGYNGIAQRVVYGLAQFTGDYYGGIVTLAANLIPVAILIFMYRQKVFLRC